MHELICIIDLSIAGVNSGREPAINKHYAT